MHTLFRDFVGSNDGMAVRIFEYNDATQLLAIDRRVDRDTCRAGVRHHLAFGDHPIFDVSVFSEQAKSKNSLKIIA